MTTYKVRSSIREGGGYNLAFGRGGAKLTAALEDAGGWRIISGDGCEQLQDSAPWRLKRDAIGAWRNWATANYRAKPHEEPPASAVEVVRPKTKKGPPPLKRKGPPSLQQSSAPAKAVDRPSHPSYVGDAYHDTLGDNPYIADFLSKLPLFERPGEGQWKITAWGVLDEVFNWMQANLPFTSSLEYPWVRVTQALQREFPDEEKYHKMADPGC